VHEEEREPAAYEDAVHPSPFLRAEADAGELHVVRPRGPRTHLGDRAIRGRHDARAVTGRRVESEAEERKDPVPIHRNAHAPRDAPERERPDRRERGTRIDARRAVAERQRRRLEIVRGARVEGCFELHLRLPRAALTRDREDEEEEEEAEPDG